MLSLISPKAVLRFEPMTYQVLHVVLQLLAHDCSLYVVTKLIIYIRRLYNTVSCIFSLFLV